jgi:ABC-2 type transport system ATP-binding protein
VIEVLSLTKSYGDHLAVDQVSFSAQPGTILGLLGPNGAGKSTVMRILAGYLVPSAGKAKVAGYDVAADSREVRRRLGYLPENARLYSEMRVREYLEYRAALKEVGRAERSEQITRALDACGLLDVRDRIIGQLSKGFRQRVALASVLLHDPPVLILDEPTVGLDPLQIREIRELVRSLGRERTVLFSTHILSEAEIVSDRVVILNHGKVLADAAPKELAARFKSQALTLELEGSAPPIVKALERIAGVEVELVADAPTVRLRLRTTNAAGVDLRPEISRAVTKAGGLILELALTGTSLDEVFARVTDEEAQS